MNINRIRFIVFSFAAAYVAILTVQTACGQGKKPEAKPEATTRNMSMTNNKIEKSNTEWQKLLNPEQFHVLREKGTERAFTGKYWNHHERGKYKCAGCGLELFASEAKFDSGCGWPSFDRPISTNAVSEAQDFSHNMRRTEVLCPKCGGHLGHVFEDGPRETTGLRYCINSASLIFEPVTNSVDSSNK